MDVIRPDDPAYDDARQAWNLTVDQRPAAIALPGSADEVAEALRVGDDDLAAANAEWQRRRDEMLRQLDGFPIVKPDGGWAALLDVRELGLDCADASARLLEHKVAATQMRGWGGEVADRHVRFVFSNEPVQRIAMLGDRVRAALAG